jgi:type IV pilus assembly protein PilN
MIRINLLGGERKVAKKAFTFDSGRQVMVACSLLLVLTAAGIGYWAWSLYQASQKVDQDIAEAKREQTRLQSILRDVAAFDQQRDELQQRVALIEQLRGGQSIPVQLLDEVSKSLPDMLWLTDLEQKGNDVTIQGQSTTLISLSDFVGNLGNSKLLQKPVEIVNSQVDTVTVGGPGGGRGAAGRTSVDLIKFTVRAQLIPPKNAPPPPPPPAGRGGGPGRGARGAAPAAPSARGGR